MSDEENCSVLVSDRQQSALKKKKKLCKSSVLIWFLFSWMLVYRTINLHLSYKQHWCIYVFKAKDVQAVCSIEATWDLSLICTSAPAAITSQTVYHHAKQELSVQLFYISIQISLTVKDSALPAASVKPWWLEPFFNLLRNTSHTLCSSVRRLLQLSGLSETHTHTHTHTQSRSKS